MFDYGMSFEFAEYAKLDDCVCWYFTGDKAIINELFPDKYPEAVFTTLSIEKYPDDDWQVSISPTLEEENGYTDYDWTDIELSISTINELISKAENKKGELSMEKLFGNEFMADSAEKIYKLACEILEESEDIEYYSDDENEFLDELANIKNLYENIF